ncbi:carbohydrate-binding domain-containing protein [Gracilibacillus phocaeensis]|uniref:carbohydrate-binding domain-containing protein n=1 Tax=Gracilibacillus phocaeensis TaxID=2042304 RepID=UPI00102F8C6F|nr:carbohydrate-binding domain-containing protein [Gracilibacillus phocaeensis]
MKRYSYLLFCMTMLGFMITGCNTVSENSDENITQQAIVDSDLAASYTDWSEDEVIKISFDDGEVDIADDESSVVVNGNTIEIHTSGTYVLEGQASDKNVVVDAEDSGTVRLILNGTSLQSTTTAPIFVKQAEETIISLEDGTDNKLVDAANYQLADDTDEPKATLYSKDDLIINGTGKLVVEGNYNDGITGKDELKVTEATVDITAVDDGIVGRDLFSMSDATITITAGGDGVKSSNDEEADKANIVLQSGQLTIDADGDGIASENTVTVLDGDYQITSGGGSPEEIEVTEEFGSGMEGEPPGEFSTDENNGNTLPTLPEQGERPSFDEGEVPTDRSEMAPPNQGEGERAESADTAVRPDDQLDNQTDEETTDDQPSTKGIKAVNKLMIAGGSLQIDAMDDALHSDKEMVITDGNISLQTGDDAIHADQTIMISNGDIQIDKSLEGIEAADIVISGGNIHVVAADDGVNISGNGSSAVSETNQEETNETTTGQLLIEDGYLYINADGDGLDSNTSVEMTGGTVLVYGPTTNQNGALDYDQSFTITGGTLLAAGSSGMAQGVSDTSTQNSVMMTFPEQQDADTMVYVTDSEGNLMTAVSPEKAFQSILISSPELQQDEQYILYTGGQWKTETTDGYAGAGSVENGSEVVTFTLNHSMMYLNEDGETEGGNEMFGPPGGQEGQDRQAIQNRMP